MQNIRVYLFFFVIFRDELKNPQGLSIYSLQKLVEVAHFNIDRIKFIWSQIWNIMREHISNVAINSIPDVSLFAVDSLKQLSIKFLKKDEFASLEFQKEFLKPFETIFEKVSDDYIKDLVLNCINYIISHVMKNIKSGWK
jgi:brefeldin A-inhibited guanine nucleotide-exchange protein